MEFIVGIFFDGQYRLSKALAFRYSSLVTGGVFRIAVFGR
jgi:hypothetical protein